MCGLAVGMQMNEKEYNLLDEKWVRVCDSSGNLIEVSLNDA